ncbi:MAG: cytochrome-c peroxidase [Gammaproteobacteria bacterium]|nr:cytochrome-c peroxidase [Gammaproteobacteria bacterium]
MNYIKSLFVVVVIFYGVGLFADQYSSDEISYSDEPIQPIPISSKANPQKVLLGEKLFHDPLLSSDNTISCASCHNVNEFGIDHLPTAVGIKGQVGKINSPTVMNSKFNLSQFWDGRAENLQEQAKGPVVNPIEMGTSWNEALTKLKNSTFYRKVFESIYPEGITINSVTDAIQEYEMTLLTKNAPFDQYLKGNINSITEEQKLGYTLFIDYGCIACHQGVNVGGNMYQRMGSFQTYFTPLESNQKPEDLGRYNVTKLEKDKYVFKVPSLRLVAHTAPYFHDGSVATLKEAIQLMAKHQLGREISDAEIIDIIDFIKSLTGTYEATKQ